MPGRGRRVKFILKHCNQRTTLSLSPILRTVCKLLGRKQMCALSAKVDTTELLGVFRLVRYPVCQAIRTAIGC